jgi:hypothetical protein
LPVHRFDFAEKTKKKVNFLGQKNLLFQRQRSTQDTELVAAKEIFFSHKMAAVPEAWMRDESYVSEKPFDKALWVEPMWHFLHVIGFNYMVHPSPEDRHNYEQFLHFFGQALGVRLGPLDLTDRHSFARSVYDLHTKHDGGESPLGLSFPRFRDLYESWRAGCDPQKGCVLARNKPCKLSLFLAPEDLFLKGTHPFKVDPACLDRSEQRDYESNDGFSTAIWAIVLWYLLHMLSFAYTPAKRAIYHGLLTYLQTVIPCKVCRENFQRVMREQFDPAEHLRDREALARFLYDAHDKVPNKPALTVSYHEMRHMYHTLRLSKRPCVVLLRISLGQDRPSFVADPRCRDLLRLT